MSLEGEKELKMPNLNYRKGYSLESWVRNHLREQGWTVIRSSGSHTPVDIIAGRHGAILAIQCKSGIGAKFGPEDVDNLLAYAAAFAAKPILVQRLERETLWFQVYKGALIETKEFNPMEVTKNV